MSDPAAAITAAVTVAIVVLLAVITMSGHGAAEELLPPEYDAGLIEQRGEAIQQTDGGEWLSLSPAQRDAEVDQLRALWEASPDPDVQTHLPADPGPHEAS